jgi:hypothetical protein
MFSLLQSATLIRTVTGAGILAISGYPWIHSDSLRNHGLGSVPGPCSGSAGLQGPQNRCMPHGHSCLGSAVAHYPDTRGHRRGTAQGYSDNRLPNARSLQMHSDRRRLCRRDGEQCGEVIHAIWLLHKVDAVAAGSLADLKIAYGIERQRLAAPAAFVVTLRALQGANRDHVAAYTQFAW